MIFQLLYLTCCLYIIWQLRRRNSKKFSSPPELSGRLPIIGHAWKMVGDRKHAFKTVKSMSEETLERGGLLAIHIGPRMVYVISDPEDCAVVANACLDKDYYYSFAKPFLGNGLTIADVPLWKQHRKYINSAFRPQVLNEFLVVFNSQAKRLVGEFKQELDRGPFNHEKYIRLNALESICMTAFGADVAEFKGLHKQYLEGVTEILDIFTERFQKFWLHSDFIFNLTSLKTRQDKVMKNIKEFTNAILQKRKAEMQENSNNTHKSGQFTPFMNLIMDLSKETNSFTDEDVLNETNTLVGGGYDTSACTITLALMLLGSHPEAQKKAFDELQEVFEKSNRDVEKDDIPRLLYIEAVLKETMRLYPIAPVVARYIVKDLQLKNFTLKAGNGIGMLFWGMHRHPVWGPDVEQFRPERWLDGSLPSNHVLGAFSIGKRGCIGKTYAMMSMKTVLSHVLRSYIISSDMSNLEFEIDAILKPAAGQNISIAARR